MSTPVDIIELHEGVTSYWCLYDISKLVTSILHFIGELVFLLNQNVYCAIKIGSQEIEEEKKKRENSTQDNGHRFKSYLHNNR